MDQISIEEVDRLARKPNSVVIRSDISVLSHFAANVQFFVHAEAHRRCHFSVHVWILAVAWSWTWITFWSSCGNIWLWFAFIPRKEEVLMIIFLWYPWRWSHSHKCVSSKYYRFIYNPYFHVERPDFNDAIIMRRGASVEHVVSKINILHLKIYICL